MHHQLLRGVPLQRRLSYPDQRYRVGGMRNGTTGLLKRKKRTRAQRFLFSWLVVDKLNFLLILK